MSEGSKYHPLSLFLRRCGQETITLSFAELEMLLGDRLPPSARSRRGWWSNRTRGAVQANAWLSAGYEVAWLDLTAGQVAFRRLVRTYHVRREGDAVLWDGALIRALRQHMGLTQIEFAQRLGVRQPTVSEWETGAYEPKRSTSRLLTYVAEQAGFPYG